MVSFCSGHPPKKVRRTRTAFKWRGAVASQLFTAGRVLRGAQMRAMIGLGPSLTPSVGHIPAASVLDQTRIAPVTQHVSDGRHDGAERSGLAVVPKRPFHWACHCTDRHHAVMAMDCLGLAGSEHGGSGYGERQKGPHGGLLIGVKSAIR